MLLPPGRGFYQSGVDFKNRVNRSDKKDLWVMGVFGVMNIVLMFCFRKLCASCSVGINCKKLTCLLLTEVQKFT